MASISTALVLQWSATTLQVQYPYCLDSHGHGIGTSLDNGDDNELNVQHPVVKRASEVRSSVRIMFAIISS